MGIRMEPASRAAQSACDASGFFTCGPLAKGRETHLSCWQKNVCAMPVAPARPVRPADGTRQRRRAEAAGRAQTDAVHVVLDGKREGVAVAETQ